MRATPALGRGFWSRSADELKRLSNIAFKLEAIKGPSGPYILHDFRDPDAIESCKVMSDEEIGGFSQSNLEWVPFESHSESTTAPETSPVGYARFHGSISTELPKDRLNIQRSGFAAWRTEDRRSTIFGKSIWDIDPFSYLAMRIKSDGRAYFINVQTESIEPTDLHQHRLFAKRPGEWETVLIKWNDFVRTNHGFVVEPQTEILRQKVSSLGIGLTDRVPGPFELCIERIWATNNPRDIGEGEVDDVKEPTDGELTNRQGKKIRWKGVE